MGGKFNTFVVTVVGGAAVVGALTIGAGESGSVSKAWSGAAGAADAGASALQKGSNLAGNVAAYASGNGISPSEYSDPRKTDQILNGGSSANNGEIVIVPEQAPMTSFMFRKDNPNDTNVLNDFMSTVLYSRRSRTAYSARNITANVDGQPHKGVETNVPCNSPQAYRYNFACRTLE